MHFQSMNLISTGGRDDSPGDPSDKENYATLLQEMRLAFNGVNRENPLLMTAAVSASKPTIDKAYPVKEMSDVLDFISVMSYDYHGWY